MPKIAHASTWGGQVPVIADHLRSWRGVTVRAQTATVLQEGQSKSLGRAASQQGRPSVPPRLAGPSSEVSGLSPGLGLDQLVEEQARFLGPPPSNFSSEDHQSCAAQPACKLRVHLLLPSAGGVQSSSVLAPHVTEEPRRA